jgi:catecholate siderophore receptor
MDRDEGSARRNPATGSEADIDRRGIAISLALNQDGASRFWINHYQVKTNDNPDYGISFNAATRRPGTILPPDTFFGNPRTFDRSSTGITTLVHEHQFAPRTLLRTQLRHADYDRSYWAKTPNLTTPPNLAGGIGGNQTRASHYTTTTLQSDLSTRFEAMGMKHEVVAGVEYLQERSSRKGLQNFGTTAEPLYLPYQEAVAGNAIRFSGDSYAVYAQDTVEFVPRWKATAGVRHDRMDATYSSATSPRLEYAENSFRGALSFHPVDQTHVYVAWSDSFSPTADLYQLTVVPLPPERSKVLEVGTKWLLFDGNLALRAALYRADKSFERNTDLEATATLLTNRRRTDGIELEAAGRITDRWEVFAGFAVMDAKILEVATNVNATTGATTAGNPGYVGQRARNTPRYTVNVWSTYRIDANWTVGGGVEAKSDRQAFNPSGAGPVPTLDGVYQPNTAPGYARWDAMVAYAVQRWTFRLNVRNLLDTVYYDAVYDTGGFTVPGVRRTVLLTTEYRL